MIMPKLGIDLAKQTFDVALLRGGKLPHRTFKNDAAGFKELAAWLRKHGVTQAHAVMESTGTYGDALAEFLYAEGHRVSLVNPARIKAFGQSELQRNKTDRADAALIARFAERHEPPAWSPPPAELRELQALVRHLDDLIAHRAALTNRLNEGRRVASVQISLQALIDSFGEQIREVEGEIRRLICRHPGLKADRDLLASIPGIGEATAARLLAEVEHLREFGSARQAAAYAGLTPRRYESGSSVRGQSRLSKIGNARVRRALYWPAITALRHNPLVRQFGQRLAERGKHKMAIIGAAMRKLIHLAYGVLKTRLPFDPGHGVAA